MEDGSAKRTRSSVAATPKVGAVGLGAAALSAVVAMLFAGCDESKHYRVLSFFFDGVPVPPELREATEESESGVAPGAGADAGSVEKETVYIYHTPYLDRNCSGCHDRNIGFDATVAEGKLCKQCHGSYSKLAEGDWWHGPAAQGECGYCHEAHKSEHRGVLKTAQPDLCFDCHDSSDVNANPVHADLQDQRCSACHDPHSAGNRRLLIDSRTYRRRARSMRPVTTPHDWEQEMCQKCHLVEKSNQLLDSAEAECLTCHANVKTAKPGQKLHEAVTNGKCLACHTPHRSRRQHLIRSGAERVCLRCHKLDQIDAAAHPNVVRVDCLICHSGHGSERPSLLRPDMMAPTDAGGTADLAVEADAPLHTNATVQEDSQ